MQERKPTNWDKYLGSFIYPYGVFQGYKKFIEQIEKDWPEGGGKVLELGSGSGRISLWTSEILPVSEIVLVDYNEKLLEKSRQLFSKSNIKARFIKEDIRNLDLNEKFDLIHNAGFLEHFLEDEQVKIVKVHKKHLKETGWVISYVPTPDFSYRFWRSLQEVLGIWRFTDEKPLTASELSDLFAKQGFNLLDRNKVWKYYLTEIGMLFNLKN